MIVDIVVPSLGESISEVEVGAWHREQGKIVKADDPVVDIESEKATVEVAAPASGTLALILKHQGEAAKVGEVIGRIDTVAGHGTAVTDDSLKATPSAPTIGEKPGARVMPAAERLLTEEKIALEAVFASGPGGRVLKEDVQAAVEKRSQASVSGAVAPSAPPSGASDARQKMAGLRSEERVRMSPLRRTIAARLLQAKQSMAMLTTFNEVDMSRVMQLRESLGPDFLEKHQIKLGFMSFFVRATVAALEEHPSLNARIEEDEIVYSKFYDIGVAIGGGRGLVVPVLRNAESMGFADIEHHVAELGRRAKTNVLSLDELTGGTFTISNGGVYGSMMSTPIVNPPQSGILGLHAIKERPVVVDGEIAIRPMMYIALSYDHRIVDGREAVTFLKRIKERIETPEKLLLEI